MVKDLPLSADEYAKIKPKYIEMPGWEESTSGVRKFEDLPVNAQNYIKKIEALIETPIHIISTGADRNDNIIIQNPFQ